MSYSMAALSSTKRNHGYVGDFISELPDDILWTFLSPMGMKEAAKTSIISKRWRYLWAKQTHMDFNHLIVFPESDPNPRNILSFTESQKNKYVNWVNQVVGLHCGTCIDTFRISFSLGSSDAHHIDKWVSFALSKKVQNLELNLFSYTIRLDMLKPSMGVGESGISFLKSLHLTSVNVSGIFLEYLLSRAHLLEQLYVDDSQTLMRLKVVGLSCKLKHLTIRSCRHLSGLEIDAANLIYFEYTPVNPFTKVVFKSTPLLFTEASFGGNCFGFVDSIFQQIAHLAAQFTKLSFNLMFGKIPKGVPTFCNLEQLNLQVGGAEFDLFSVTRFVMACPVLSEFKLEIAWHRDNPGIEADELQEVDLSNANVVHDNVEFEERFNWEYFEERFNWEYFDGEGLIEETTHPNLKVVQIVGFNGCAADVELILCLVFLACNLETIICDPKRFFDRPIAQVVEASRSRAVKLAKRIPPKINLVIL